MGYFLDYELFTPCWYCGKTECSGNHPEANKQAQKLPHHTKGYGHPDCHCHVCKNMRTRKENRKS